MVRFQPDNWLEGWLRPIIMMDPQGGIYFEGMAPDWRPALCALLLVVGWASRRKTATASPGAKPLVWALLATLYLWTFTVGNGRYFMAGLILLGPLLVLAWRQLPGTPGLRYAALAGLLVLQFVTMAPSYKPNLWGLAEWDSGSAIDLSPSPVRNAPAVFVTSTAISYSILVPSFHPESRWTNVVGQRDIRPGMREYAPLVDMLNGPLPKYAVMPIPARPDSADDQPTALVRQVYTDLLLPYGLTLRAQACTVLRSRLAPGPPLSRPVKNILRGFWVCPLDYSDARRREYTAVPVASERVAEAFRRIEERCPRFFPPGNSTDRKGDQLVVRHYATDMRLLADDAGQLSMRYFRALNPTPIGSLDQVLKGDFTLPCDKPPGRYQLPWNAE